MKKENHDRELEKGSIEPEKLSICLDSQSFMTRDVGSLLPGRPRFRRIPLSIRQRRLWDRFALQVGASIDHFTVIVRWNGLCDENLLRAALRATITDHQFLRTTLGTNRGDPHQVIWSEADRTDTLRVIEDSGDRSLEDFLGYASSVSFDLDRGPLLQLVLVKGGIEPPMLIFSLNGMVANSAVTVECISHLVTHYRLLEMQVGKDSPTGKVQSSLEFADDGVAKSGEMLRVGCEHWQGILDRVDGSEPNATTPCSSLEPSVRGVHAFSLHRQRQAIIHLAGAHQTTVLTVLMAAFVVSLEEEIEHDKLLPGTNRATTSSEDFIEISLMDLPKILCIKIQRGMSFVAVLDRFRECLEESEAGYGNIGISFCAGTKDHPDLPLDRLSRFGLSFHSLDSDSKPDLLDPFVEIKSVTRHSSCYALHFNCMASENRFAGFFDYCTQSFQTNRVEKIASRVVRLLNAVVEDSDRALEDMQSLGGDEQRLLVHDLNDSYEAFEDECLQALIEAQVARTPHAIAVRCGESALTYEELNRHANRLAHYLRRKDITRGDVIGICLSASEQALIAILASVKAGAAYVPMDVNYPINRLRHMVDNAKMSAVLSSSAYSETTSYFSGIDVIQLDETDWLSKVEHSDNPNNINVPDDLLYVVYTSGSTGLPKGAGVRHRNESNLLKWYCREYELNREDRTLLISSLGFDLTQKNLFALLTVGGCVVFPEEQFYDPINIRKEIQDHRITIINCAPSVFYPLQEREEDWCFLASLRCVLFGGEPIQLTALCPWLRYSGCELVNMYGPTECTDIAATYRYNLDDSNAVSLPIGRPNSNVKLYVLKPGSTNLVPFGAPGELCIGGAGVGIGYLNNPEQTNEAFIDNPFESQAGDCGKLYRTGDLVKYLEDGNLWFLGRLDNQVKIRGFRIELGEIEATLRKHPKVREAVVLASDGVSEERFLVGCFVSKAENEIQDRELRQHLSSTLPGYMVPQHLIGLSAMPLTPNGKIDRQRLLRIALARRTETGIQSADEGFDVAIDALGEDAVQNTVEARLCEIWKNLLKLRSVRIDDDFFEIGGHSLLAVKMMSSVEEEFGRRFPLATLMRARTITAFAKVLRADDCEQGWKSLVPIRPEGSRIPLFLIHAAGGNVLVYEALAKHLGPDQPVYGFQSQGLDGKQMLHRTLESMATAYRIEIQRFQPQGPYLLGGYCMGGTIALEIATQLTELGQDVAMVSLVDCHNWASVENPSIFGRLRYNGQKILFHLLNLVHLDAVNRKRFLRGKFEELKRRKSVWLGKLRKRRVDVGTELDQATALAAVWANNDRAAIEYRPRSYSGRITQFLPKTNYSHLQNSAVGWTQIAKAGVDVKYLPVYPAGMLMEPYVQRLASEMLARINATPPLDGSQS